MNEFALWFWRPIAEMLGVLAMMLGLAACWLAWVLGVATYRWIKEKFSAPASR